jgi:hypothetical protein
MASFFLRSDQRTRCPEQRFSLGFSERALTFMSRGGRMEREDREPQLPDLLRMDLKCRLS